ncbi:ribosome maturation factor RimP [Virgibacillus sp. MSJ-26]|uniref:ribosome maturation factor RimP n=1 Tax=Virgibacillus sp. MSJ-26 TaxID=2841522 RepID=UPI001C10A8B8|nr:ribosome maturation factor RimP [Virgibacillus sp. MSJ-26]MBU5466741.1 ribosome maturation factor RimP [Virgibacillus sp. MSJ-26]
MMSNVIQTTEKLVEPILVKRDLELVDVEYVKEGPNWFLRVYIDKEGGVDIMECGEVSEELSEALDKEDPIKGAYFLEVSSPGVERPLKTKKDFQESINKNVHINLYAPINGEKELEGVLKDFVNDVATIEYRFKHTTKQIDISFNQIAKARLAVAL